MNKNYLIGAVVGVTTTLIVAKIYDMIETKEMLKRHEECKKETEKVLKEADEAIEILNNFNKELDEQIEVHRQFLKEHFK